MKRQLFFVLACMSLTLQSLTADFCASDFCASETCTDCFGFDSILFFGVGGGYRIDSLKWKAYPEANPGREIEEQWKNVGMGVVETNAQLLVCEHYLFKVDFDCGWFSNSGSQRYTDNDLFGIPVSYKAKPRGNAYNLSGGLGYQFNFDCYRLSLAPLVGYSRHQQRFKGRTYDNEYFPTGPEVLAHNNYKYRWSGPWLGFALAYQATREFQVLFDYSYHWLRFKGNVRENFFPGQLPSHIRSNNAYGNEFIVAGVYTFCDCWFVGVKFNYKQFCGNKGSFRNEEDEESSRLRKLDWQSSTITLDIGYAF
jgi:hypothetical protein